MSTRRDERPPPQIGFSLDDETRDALVEVLALMRARLKVALTPDEAALLLSISRTRVYELMERGDLVAIRSGRATRIRRAEVMAWAKRQEEEERCRVSDVVRVRARFTGSRRGNDGPLR